MTGQIEILVGAGSGPAIPDLVTVRVHLMVIGVNSIMSPLPTRSADMS